MPTFKELINEIIVSRLFNISMVIGNFWFDDLCSWKKLPIIENTLYCTNIIY
jgi:hypothetical protein